MRRRIALAIGTLACVMLLVALVNLANAQVPGPAAAPTLPPLLHLRLVGPTGMKVTLYHGEPAGVTLDAPCVVGVRPGYAYRLALSNIPGFQGATFCPTLEVRGSLWLTSQLRNADFPATVVFSAEDFAKVERGAFVKKIVVLERPETAEPTAARAESPIEIRVPTARDPFQEAQERGAPLAVVYLGQRTLSPQELAESAVPGTLFLAGVKALPPPRTAPWLPWACYPVADPRLGPAKAGDFMSLYDGGDVGSQAGYNRDGQIKGIDPTDTIAEYVDAQGKARIVASNRVFLCVPRFIIVRSDTGLVNQTSAFAPGHAHMSLGGATLHTRLPLAEHTQPLFLESAVNRLKPSGTQFTAGTSVTGKVNGVEVAATQMATNTLDGSCPPPTSQTPDRPLRIIKWPDKKGCIVGETVMFSLRYTNHGAQPITNLVVSDSLTTRFEYMAGSQKGDRESTFTIQPNEADSTLLRWEIPGALQPGESGLITFQVRIR